MSSVQNIPPQFFKDLREKAIPLAITFLLGLPALGIMIPEVFSIIAHTPNDSGGFAILFKLFTFIYFSFPLIVLVILTIFQLKEGIVNQLRSELTFFLIAILLVIFFLSNTWLFSKKIFSTDVSFYIKFVLAFFILLGFVFLVWKEITRITKERQKSINREANNIDSGHIADDNLDDFIKFSIWFLYAAAQIIVTICTTVFYHLESWFFFCLFEAIVYAIPFLVYCFHPMGCKRKKPRSKLSFKVVRNDLNVRIFLLTSIVLILLNLYPCKDFKNTSYKSSQEDKTYQSYFEPSIELNSQLLKSLKSIDIQTDLQLKVTLVDSLFKGYDTTKNKDIANTKIKDFIKDSNLINRKITAKNMNDDTLKFYYDSSFALNIFNKKELGLYRKLIENEYVLVEKKAKKKLLELILNTQNKGVMVFLSTFVILLSFLLINFYTSKEEQQTDDSVPEKPILKELGTIKAMLAGVFLIALVLFIPFIKPVMEKDIIASNPWGLFQLSNWNLTPTLPAEAEPTESLTKSIRDSPKLTDSMGKACCYCPSSHDNTVPINTAGNSLFKSRIIEIRMAGLDSLLENIKLELNTLSQKISTITPKVSVEYKIESDKNLKFLIESLNTSVGQIASSLKNTDTPLLKIADSIGKLQKEVDALNKVIQNYNGNQKRNINLKN